MTKVIRAYNAPTDGPHRLDRPGVVDELHRLDLGQKVSPVSRDSAKAG